MLFSLSFEQSSRSLRQHAPPCIIDVYMPRCFTIHQSASRLSLLKANHHPSYFHHFPNPLIYTAVLGVLVRLDMSVRYLHEYCSIVCNSVTFGKMRDREILARSLSTGNMSGLITSGHKGQDFLNTLLWRSTSRQLCF